MKILLSGFCLLSFLSLSAQDSLTILFAGDAMMHQKQLDNTRRGDFFDLGRTLQISLWKSGTIALTVCAVFADRKSVV